MRLKNKSAVVLGASAQSGTGWAIAQALASAGANVIVAARNLPRLQALVDRIAGHAVQCDAAEPDDIARLAEIAKAKFGSIDIAVNAAGEAAIGLIGDIDSAAVERSLQVNFLGHFHFVRHMTAAMRHGGSVSLISSAASAQPAPGRFAYGCAKAATDCLVRHAALEYGPRGIRVNSILPGPIRTDWLAEALADPDVEAAFLRETPLGRLALPSDIAQIVLWLSSCTHLTGLNLPASGGMHLMRSPRLGEG